MTYIFYQYMIPALQHVVRNFTTYFVSISSVYDGIKQVSIKWYYLTDEAQRDHMEINQLLSARTLIGRYHFKGSCLMFVIVSFSYSLQMESPVIVLFNSGSLFYMYVVTRGVGVFKNSYELVNLGKVFCMEFQRGPLIFHIKHLTHTLK